MRELTPDYPTQEVYIKAYLIAQQDLVEAKQALRRAYKNVENAWTSIFAQFRVGLEPPKTDGTDPF